MTTEEAMGEQLPPLSHRWLGDTNEFFNEIKKRGGWPPGPDCNYVGLPHGSEGRRVIFHKEKVNHTMHTTLYSREEYQSWEGPPPPSKTPVTDHCEVKGIHFPQGMVVPSSVSRKLERELEKAIEVGHRKSEESTEWMVKFTKMRDERNKLGDALLSAETWIREQPHGDNCYLDPEHSYGNSCNCGKESILSYLESVSESLPDEDEPDWGGGEG